MDRWLTVNVVAPLKQVLDGRREVQRIPILMYHAITDDPEPGVRGYYRLNTPPALFRRHLQILKDEGFAVVDLPTAAEVIAGRQAWLGKVAVITFDDGFHDFLTAALPALCEAGFTATMFLPTGYIGGEFKGRRCLSWSEIREIRRSAACVFGSHTVTHPKLWELNDEQLESELRNSREMIERELGQTIDLFAHPYAFPRTDTEYVRRYRDAMTRCGFRIGVTTALGCARPGDDPLTLKRLPANSADDQELFRAKLVGAYDWLERPQTVVKRLKQFASQ